jgi:L-aspartate oxidase
MSKIEHNTIYPDKADVIIIGSGASSLCLALQLAENYTITILTKDKILSGSSPYAQGGIAAATGSDDSPQSHSDDTIKAGANLNQTKVVNFTTEAAPEAINWLIKQGVQFTRETDTEDLHRSKEGGHSLRRVLHVADRTGHAILQTLREKALNHSNIYFLEQHIAIDCIIDNKQCIGVKTLRLTDNRVINLYAHSCVLASGGANSLFPHTTNPWMASGDGIAMAWRAGCRIANMEFHQFHPTALYNPNQTPFLITEALRGEGAKLRLPNDERFMDKYSDQAELAPRDIVARAIHQEMQQHRIDHIYLDVTHIDAARIKRLFPTIYKHCLKFNIDITTDKIPVVPASHYTCGGVITDLNAQTDITNLYAIGETAHTGFHGANRMASNSLLECLVFANKCAAAIQQNHTETPINFIDDALNQPKHQPVNSSKIQALQQQIKQVMWQYVGIVRSDQGLQTGLEQILNLEKTLITAFSDLDANRETIETKNLIDVAILTIKCAQQRKESRGLHYNLDHPETSTLKKDSIIPSKEPE